MQHSRPAFATSLAEQLRFTKFLDSVPGRACGTQHAASGTNVYVPLAFALPVAVRIFITTIVMAGRARLGTGLTRSLPVAFTMTDGKRGI